MYLSGGTPCCKVHPLLMSTLGKFNGMQYCFYWLTQTPEPVLYSYLFFIHYRCINHAQQLCWWNNFGKDKSVMFSASSAFVALALQWAQELPGWSFSEISCLQVLIWVLISSLRHEDWLFLSQDPLQKLV